MEGTKISSVSSTSSVPEDSSPGNKAPENKVSDIPENPENKPQTEGWDCFVGLVENDTIKCLDQGYIKLINVSPRIVPVGRTPECEIVMSARISYGAKSLKSLETDNNLVRYLIENKHTSTLEHVKFTFEVYAPIFVLRQWFRHRMANYNEESQRYTEMKEDVFYHPSTLETGCPTLPEGGIRIQSKVNHQGSHVMEDGEQKEKIKSLVQQMEGKIEEVFDLYHQCIELGMAKECARFALPVATYSKMMVTVDLNNMLKFLHLRTDSHAQAEIRVYANAMLELVKPLIPVTYSVFMKDKESVFVNQKELVLMFQTFMSRIQTGISENSDISERDTKKTLEKMQKLGL